MHLEVVKKASNDKPETYIQALYLLHPMIACLFSLLCLFRKKKQKKDQNIKYRWTLILSYSHVIEVLLS